MRIEVYRRVTIYGRRWFWRIVAKNGKKIATGGEGFHNRLDVLATLASLKRDLPGVPIYVEGTLDPRGLRVVK